MTMLPTHRCIYKTKDGFESYVWCRFYDQVWQGEVEDLGYQQGMGSPRNIYTATADIRTRRRDIIVGDFLNDLRIVAVRYPDNFYADTITVDLQQDVEFA